MERIEMIRGWPRDTPDLNELWHGNKIGRSTRRLYTLLTGGGPSGGGPWFGQDSPPYFLPTTPLQCNLCGAIKKPKSGLASISWQRRHALYHARKMGLEQLSEQEFVRELVAREMLGKRG